jgi:diguanylate cyclase (GGDEF)-like protein
MKKILLIEDSQFFQGVVKNGLERDGLYEVIIAHTMQDAREKLAYLKDDIFLAFVDVTLPDAMDGEAVKMCRELDVPTIIFSSRYEESISESLYDVGAIDYVIKSSPSSISYMRQLVHRLEKNKKVTALIVDSNKESSEYFSSLLSRYFINVIVVQDGSEARKIFVNQKDEISLVLLSNKMGGSDHDSYKLLQNMRKVTNDDSLIVIGMADSKDSMSVSRFLKYGANDYVSNDCTPEEFLSRLTQNLNMLDRVNDLLDAAHKDFMTGLYNRRFLFDAGQRQYDAARRSEKNVSVAVLDIDFFKKVNDTYGHDAGDYVIKKIASILKEQFRSSDIVSRMGGEEFCVLTPNMNDSNAVDVFERLRQKIEAASFVFEGITISITASIGLCVDTTDNLDAAITKADELLYNAKNNGRNQVQAG